MNERLPEFGSVEYLHRMMRYWLEQSVMLRERYAKGAASSIANGHDQFYWATDLNAKGIVADQGIARDETQKYALALSAQIAYEDYARENGSFENV